MVAKKNPVVVSLTTMGTRRKGLEKTLLSIIENSVKPDFIRVYYSSEPFLLDPGMSEKDTEPIQNNLRPICQRHKINLEFKETPNIGSFRKLIPALKEFPNAIIITIDDDQIYEKNLIKTLLGPYKTHHCIVGGRVKSVNLWSLGTQQQHFSNLYLTRQYNTPFLHNYPVGCGAILYHTSMFSPAFASMEYSSFPHTVLKNDDMFFRLYTLRKNIPVISVNTQYTGRKSSGGGLYSHFNRVADVAQIRDECLLCLPKE